MAALAEIMGQVSSQMEPALKERFPNHPNVVSDTTKFIKQMGGAPVCVLAFQLKPDYTNKTSSTMIQSVSAAIENMILSAWEKGIGSCWLTAPLETGKGEELRARFAPDKRDFVAMITFGYPEKVPTCPPRKDRRYEIL